MDFTAVLLNIDDDFGLTLCRGFLERGGVVIGGTAERNAGALEALGAEHGARFRAITMDPGSITSLRSAARELQQAGIGIDLLVANVDRPAHGSFDDGFDFEAMKQTYDVNALAPIRFVEAFLPLMAGGRKRLCFVTSASGSIGMTAGSGSDFAYGMAKTALNRAVMILFNALRRDGYTFRLLVPATEVGMEVEMAALMARDDFLRDRDDEFRLAIADGAGNEWPF